MVYAFPRLEIETTTKRGRQLRIREMALRDISGLMDCVNDNRFSMPYLTGTKDPIGRPVRPLPRAINYFILSFFSRILGRVLFGARRHWLMAIEDRPSGAFIGVVLLDAVVRLPPSEGDGIGGSLVEGHKVKSDARVGDGEIGFFLKPDYWREGIGIQAIYALMSGLSQTRSWCLQDGMILQRVWAETGDYNGPAQGLLKKMGLVLDLNKSIPADRSPRYNRDGSPVGLLHFSQPETDEATPSKTAVSNLISRMEGDKIGNNSWSFVCHKFVG